MALIQADRVKENSSTTGTGNFALGGAAAGFRTFADGVGVSNTCYYVITDGSSSVSYTHLTLPTIYSV